MTQILVAPDGKLWLLSVSHEPIAQHRFRAELHPLTGADAPGAESARYFVDD